jgi:hypothetical protein
MITANCRFRSSTNPQRAARLAFVDHGLQQATVRGQAS